MRKIVYSVAMSLDGYLAGPNGEADWIVMDPEIDFVGMMARFDTVLMGRRTFEAVQAQGGGGSMPWVGETAAIVMRHGSHVWVDSVWLPTISYHTAKRAFHEWLDVMPSNRILWGADCNHAEGIYGATEMTRRCLTEVLAERVERGELTEPHAQRIGKQVLRDNALALFPQHKERLWRGKGRLTPETKP